MWNCWVDQRLKLFMLLLHVRQTGSKIWRTATTASCLPSFHRGYCTNCVWKVARFLGLGSGQGSPVVSREDVGEAEARLQSLQTPPGLCVVRMPISGYRGPSFLMAWAGYPASLHKFLIRDYIPPKSDLKFLQWQRQILIGVRFESWGMREEFDKRGVSHFRICAAGRQWVWGRGGGSENTETRRGIRDCQDPWYYLFKNCPE